MKLKTPRLILRPLCIKDVETVFAYSSIPENTRYVMWGSKTKSDVLSFLEGIEIEWQKAEPDYYEFAVVLDGLQIGSVSAYLNETRTEAEVGWIIHKDYWHKGYITEAALVLRDFLFKEIKLERLIAHCDERNIPSFKVMKKLGMKIVFTGEERIYPLTGEKSTELMCELKREDFNALC